MAGNMDACVSNNSAFRSGVVSGVVLEPVKGKRIKVLDYARAENEAEFFAWFKKFDGIVNPTLIGMALVLWGVVMGRALIQLFN